MCCFAGEAGSAVDLNLQAPGSQQIESCTLVRTAGPDEKGLDRLEGVDLVSGRTSALVDFEEDKVHELVPVDDQILLVEDKVNDVLANCCVVFFRGKRPAIPAVTFGSDHIGQA